ncbi:MAG TPA: PspA/IM30 family protein [Kouleothrix sp.]|uniref:PspA/IM30 family protein n=1 Tax=Kouleothrix sp. TaxID=2779161 RepID=UPI002CF0B76D|nr:PspA/IM30 family protein [Kouleothrix sp.]HRC77861.1 PspA/IM30 family protein [Kouleothrix sp.]
MSIFTRISDLLSANINSLLDKAEDPEKMADEYLRQLNSELYEAKTSVASAMADATKLNNKEAQYLAETEQWNNKAEAALRAGDENLAKAALARKVQAQKLAQQYTQQSDAQDEQVAALQQALVQLETRIAETKAKRELIVAKKNRAQTQEAMQRMARGLSSTGALDKLDQLEERVDDRLARADAMAKLESGTLESKFKDLERDQEVNSELAELKRKLGQQ